MFGGDSVTYFNGADAYSSWVQPLQLKYLPEGFTVCAETTYSDHNPVVLEFLLK